MYKFEIEEYYNDRDRSSFVKVFNTLTEAENWIFNQMQRDYSDKDKGMYYMYWPYLPNNMGRISFDPTFRGPSYWIHMISNDKGIIFSDGVLTAQQKHKNEEAQEWFIHCHEKQFAPKFNFI